MKINLTLPTSWGTCTIEQLEQICMAQQVAMQLPADQQGMAWKVECFLRLAGLEVMEEQQKDEQGESFVVVRRTTPKGKENATAGKNGGETGQGEFRLYLWQIQYWVSENLAFLDTPPNVVRFPYPEWVHKGVKFKGPSLYCADWTWGQYRQVQDYWTYYFKMAEKLRDNGITSSRYNANDNAQYQEATAMLLATLYTREVEFVDDTTHMVRKDYRFVPNQSTANKSFFLTVPDIRMAVVMMWWSTMVRRLVSKYPKCFPSPNKKEKKVKKPKMQDPLEEYARTTATLEKYMGVNEQELQQETFTVVLQHLNDIIVHNEEMERLNRKSK